MFDFTATNFIRVRTLQQLSKDMRFKRLKFQQWILQEMHVLVDWLKYRIASQLLVQLLLHNLVQGRNRQVTQIGKY